MKYYLGGYYLIKLRPKNFGTEEEHVIYTCSECANDNLVDVWAYSWTSNTDNETMEAKQSFRLTETEIISIRAWVNNKHKENKLGWVNVFADLHTVIEYKNTFFSHLGEVKVMALYFDEKECNRIIKEFKPRAYNMGEIGLRLTLLKQIEEKENEVLIGYDYIGIEIGGGFHTFHCHDLGKELSVKYNLTLNKYGLFENTNNSNQVLDYLNNDSNVCEPVPWFIVKTKLVSNE